MRTDIFLIFALRKVALGNQKTRFHCNRLHFPYRKKQLKIRLQTIRYEKDEINKTF